MKFIYYILCSLLLFMNYGVNGSGFNYLLDSVYNFFNSERCSPYFTAHIEPKALMDSIESQVFGQPFVTEALLPLLISHRKYNKYHQKALVLSFHGSPGTGKNFVAKIIVEHLFKKGMDSGYAKHFNGRTHFLRSSKLDEYKIQLFREIAKQLKFCKYSIFIFDEVEKFPESILDSLKYFVDYNSQLSGYSFENSIFIFLSNSGMETINKKSYELWQRNTDRRDFKLHEFQHLISDVFNADGALKNSELITSSLIDLFIPFLPLEKKHVIQCIKKEAENYNNVRISPEAIEEILLEIDFQPEDTQAFARSGCKNLFSKMLVATRRSKHRHIEF